MKRKKHDKTITDEVKNFLHKNPDVVLLIANDNKLSHHTVRRWVSMNPERFAKPAILKILAKKMGKKQGEITEPLILEDSHA